MTLEVTRSSDGNVMTCANTKKCRVIYDWDYTPKIFHVVPQILYPGMVPTIYMNPKNAQNYKSPTDLCMDVRVDGTRLNYKNGWTDVLADTSFQFGNNNLAQVSGTIETEARNAEAQATVFFRGAGYAMNEKSTETCLFDGTTCYTTKLMPTVKSISQSQGYAEGGQTLSITGTSLDGDVTVTVDGVPCSVESTSQREVTCTTGKKDLSAVVTTPSSYVGQQGLNRYIIDGKKHNDWRGKVNTGDIVGKDIWTALDFSWADPIGAPFKDTTQVFEGLFKAPASGEYRFFMSCDD